MTLAYTVTKDDYYHFCMYSYDHNEVVKKQVLLVRLLYGGIILLISILILLFSNWRNPLLYAGILWAISAVLIANTRRSLRKTNQKQYRRQIAAGKGAEFLGDYRLELLDDRIVLSVPSRKSEIGYDAVEGIGEDGHCLYVRCGSLSALLVPLTAFETEDQRTRLVGILQEKCVNVRA